MNTEVCNGLDDDCDGSIDEEAADATSWFGDADRDGFGDNAAELTACTAPEGFVANRTDCNERLSESSPGTIEIRATPIQFELATERILPVSIPTLEAIALLLQDNPRIQSLVIEGHASEEGSYAYNYDPSIRRARSVWEQLLTGGVHPDRLAYRGIGEVAPSSLGNTEAELAPNRRVVFRITSTSPTLDPDPVWPLPPPLPWSGEPVPAVAPPLIVAPPPKEPPAKEPDPFKLSDDEEE